MNDIMQHGFDTRPITLEPLWRVAFQAPEEDVDRIFREITSRVPLRQGNTDRNAWCSAPGREFYRPLEGTPTGAEDDSSFPILPTVGFGVVLVGVLAAFVWSRGRAEPVSR